jgi:hypothetical protein
MKKVISLLALSILFTNNINAETNTYISLKYANGSGTETIEYPGATLKGDFDMSEISLGVGFILAEDNHIELNYNTMDTDAHDLKSFGIDYIKSLSRASFEVGKIKLKPEFDAGLKYYDKVNDRNGIGIRLGLGISAEISTNFELGLGYEYQYIQWESKSTYYGDIDASDKIFDLALFGRFRF